MAIEANFYARRRFAGDCQLREHSHGVSSTQSHARQDYVVCRCDRGAPSWYRRHDRSSSSKSSGCSLAKRKFSA